MPEPIPPVMDYVGPFGGAMWSAFAAGVAAASTVLVSTGALIWRMFGDARIKALEAEIKQMKADHEADRRDERQRCDKEIADLRLLLVQMQTAVISAGPPALRSALQAIVVVASEDEKDRQ